MEKPPRSKGKIFSFLPKTATVSFQNPPYSPGREKRSENFKAVNGGYKSFSGPIISIIPAEARRKSKNGSFDSQEPTSPKVSCMGQIKHKNKISKSKRDPSPSPPNTDHQHRRRHQKQPKQKKNSKQGVDNDDDDDEKQKIKPKRSSSSLRNIFRGAISRRRKSNSSNTTVEPPLMPDRAPSLSQMKRFESGRTGLADFNWREFVVDHERKCFSDEEKEESDEEEEEDEVIIPHSAPIMVGAGRVALEPRKEINLWKRRTVAPIRPLELK